MFDFRLQVFNTVANRLNFTKAAEELHITQPAVTKHIHEIEHHFKIKLFERKGTKIKLTTAGGTLLQYTNQLFAIYRNLEFEMNELTQHHSGILRIGSSTTVAQYVLPPLLAAFHQKFKDLQVKLTINNTEAIEQALNAKQIDLGIIEGQSKNIQFKYTEFIKDELVLVANTKSILAEKQVITADDLLKIPLLLREPGSGTLEVIAHALKPIGIRLEDLKTEMELGSTESIKRYLLNADCMAFLSIHSILKELDWKELTIIDIKGVSIDRNFYFIQEHGQAAALPDLFMKFASQYNFRL